MLNSLAAVFLQNSSFTWMCILRFFLLLLTFCFLFPLPKESCIRACNRCHLSMCVCQHLAPFFFFFWDRCVWRDSLRVTITFDLVFVSWCRHMHTCAAPFPFSLTHATIHLFSSLCSLSLSLSRTPLASRLRLYLLFFFLFSRSISLPPSQHKQTLIHIVFHCTAAFFFFSC